MSDSQRATERIPLTIEVDPEQATALSALAIAHGVTEDELVAERLDTIISLPAEDP